MALAHAENGKPGHWFFYYMGNANVLDIEYYKNGYELFADHDHGKFFIDNPVDISTAINFITERLKSSNQQ